MSTAKVLRLVRLADPLLVCADEPFGSTAETLLGRVLAQPRPRHSFGFVPRTRVSVIFGFAAAVLFVPVAVALHRQVFDLIAGKPAPPPVVKSFQVWSALHADELRQSSAAAMLNMRFPSIEADQARGVVAMNNSTGSISLWEAPQQGGTGQCWLFVFAPARLPTAGMRGLSGSCDIPSASGTAAPIDPPQVILSCALPNDWVVHVRVRAAVSLRLQFSDGSSQELDAFDGHAVASGSLASAVPVMLDARDEGGQLVLTYPIRMPAHGQNASGSEGCSNTESGGNGSFFAGVSKAQSTSGSAGSGP